MSTDEVPAGRLAFLLSPYSLPTDHPLMLTEPEMSAWLNGYLALWHPAALAGLAGPPKQASQYEHESPLDQAIYAVPDAPDMYLPEDWQQRLETARAVSFSATAMRGATFTDLLSKLDVIDASPEALSRRQLPVERVRPFVAIGFGFLVVDHLFTAMQHQQVLNVEEFWGKVQAAIGALNDPDPEAYRVHLQGAADLLLAARETMYTATIHLLDLVVPDDRQLDATLPKSFNGPQPINLIASGQVLERIRDEHAERFAELRRRIDDPSGTPTLEVCTGAVVERPDSVLPIESQLWNMRRARDVAKELLNAEVRVYARRRSAFHAQTPQLLHATGYEKAILAPFDNATVPTHRSPVISWSSADGKHLDAFTRAALPAHLSQTFFNIVHSLHESIMQDTAATVALSRSETPSHCYDDWMELSKFGPVLGQWTTFSRYFSDTTAGEYAPSSGVDDFVIDDLDDRNTIRLPDAVTAFQLHLRLRRRIDTAWSFLAILRGLGVGSAGEVVTQAEDELAAVEDQFERSGQQPDQLESLETRTAQLLTNRLQVRSEAGKPGLMFLNPCSFIRRMAVEIEGVGPIATEGVVKASQQDGDIARLVVEVPAFGFAWIPRSGGTPAKARLKTAEGNLVRNEFFEAEMDPVHGGLRAFRDLKTRMNRLGQQVVFNPGSTAKCRSIKITAAGAAMGEVTSEGEIFNEQNELLAQFRQRIRAWMGRPLLEMRLEIYPEKKPEGYPWHHYFGARFAWRDERTILMRGCSGGSFISNHTRPVTSDFVELRFGTDRTAIFTSGLPFLQRHGSRMLDLILVTETEESRVFDFSLGIEREYPVQTALGLHTPATMIPTEKGPPHIGTSGWLFHLDAPNLAMTGLRPTIPTGEATAAIVATLIESTSYGGGAELRCVRNPSRACTIDGHGHAMMELGVTGDAVALDAMSSELMQVRVEFA